MIAATLYIPKNYILVITVFAVLSCAQAANAQMGGLRGTVRDADFGVPLRDVTIRIDGPSPGAVKSDADGNFLITDVSPGTYSATASREGFVSEIQRGVVISAGSLREISLSLTAQVFVLDEFVVTAEDLLEGDEAGLVELRLGLDSLANIVSSDFISKSGASDAGEALIKIAGTSVVDSRYVVVRGLSDRYNTVVLNGARVPSSDPDRRAVNVDIFPGGVIGSLVNSKTFTPDLPGESTGGYINVITKDIPTENYANGSVSLGYNTQATNNPDFLQRMGPGTGILGTKNDKQREISGFLRNAPRVDQVPAADRELYDQALHEYPSSGVTTKTPPMNFGFSTEVGQVYDINGHRLGLLGAFTYSKSYDYDPDTLQGRTNTDFVRTELIQQQQASENLLAGLLLAGSYEVTDNDTLRLVFFGNIAAEDEAFFGTGLTDTQAPVPLEDFEGEVTDLNNFFIREASIYTQRNLASLQLSGSHVFTESNDATLDWVAAYSRSSQDEPDYFFSSYEVFKGNRATSGGGNPLPGSPYERGWRELEDDNYFLAANTEVPLFGLADEDVRPILKFGGSFDRTHRDFEARTFGITSFTIRRLAGPSNFLQEFDPDNTNGLTPGDVISDVSVGTFPPGVRPVNLNLNQSAKDFYFADQNLAAAYTAMSADLTENFEMLAGFRAELTDIQITTDNTDRDTSLDGLFPPGTTPGEPVDISQVDVLPVAAATWDFAENQRFRFAATRTIARPSFKELAPIPLREPGDGRYFVGNAELVVSTITNLDLRWEWFPGGGADLFAVSAFTKDIQDPIEFTRNSNADFFLNEEEARLYGFEIEAQKNLGFLAPMLEVFDIGMNLAILESETTLSEETRRNRVGTGLSPTRPLQGQPDSIFNFNLTYEREDWGLFAGLFLNVTGDLLYQAGGLPGADSSLDVFQRGRTQLNFTLAKELTDRLKLTFRAEDLTNSEVRREFSDGSPYEITTYGITYSLGLSGEW